MVTTFELGFSKNYLVDLNTCHGITHTFLEMIINLIILMIGNGICTYFSLKNLNETLIKFFTYFRYVLY